MSDAELLKAADSADVSAVRRCLEGGANINATTARGMTPLMMAAWRGHEEVARELLKHGPDFSPRAADGWRALTYAATNTFEGPDGRTQILQALIDAGDAPKRATPTGKRFTSRPTGATPTTSPYF